ncbi:unnamed protein product, partial [marine sediment metagenome]
LFLIGTLRDSLCDRVVVYASMDKNVVGKPRVEATRERVVVRGATCADDMLYTLQDKIVETIKEFQKISPE